MESCQLHESLIKRIESCESEIKSLQTTGNDLNARQVRAETKLDYITDQIKTLTDQIKTLSDKIDKILEKPGKRYESIMTTITTSLAIAAITGLATAFFMRGGH